MLAACSSNNWFPRLFCVLSSSNIIIYSYFRTASRPRPQNSRATRHLSGLRISTRLGNPKRWFPNDANSAPKPHPWLHPQPSASVYRTKQLPHGELVTLFLLGAIARKSGRWNFLLRNSPGVNELNCETKRDSYARVSLGSEHDNDNAPILM